MSEQNRDKRSDLKPTDLNVYGYCVLYRPEKEGAWKVDSDDEYLHIPAHYMFVHEALDRVQYLRERGINARVGALLAEPTDTPAEFERNRINGREEDSD
jgi:hypothetical protein